MKKEFALSLLLMSPLLASADEVDSVFGFKLNEPLNLPACTLSGNGMYANASKVTCIQPPQGLDGYDEKIRRITLSYEEEPFWLQFSRVFAFEKDGKLVGVMFVTTGYDSQDAVENTLTYKFGSEPYYVIPYVLKNQYGAEYHVSNKKWYSASGIVAEYSPDVNVYNSDLNDLGAAHVYYTTKEGREYIESIKSKYISKERAL